MTKRDKFEAKWNEYINGLYVLEASIFSSKESLKLAKCIRQLKKIALNASKNVKA